jgi:hypothetical protein
MVKCNGGGLKISETVNDLVQKLTEERGLSLLDAVVEVHGLHESGSIRIIDPDPPRDFSEYVLSFYSSWFWLVVSALTITILSVYVLPAVPPFSWVRVLFGFITSLYLPGYTFIEALYPQRVELEELERFALGIGLSLALTPLTGFVLNYTPWGIRLDPVLTVLSLLTFSLGIIGVYRKYRYHLLSLEVLK